MEKLSNAVLAAAISEFHALNSEDGGRRIKNLLRLLIDELRIMNDTCRPEELQKNQGRIGAYVNLLDCLERGLLG